MGFVLYLLLAIAPSIICAYVARKLVCFITEREFVNGVIERNICTPRGEDDCSPKDVYYSDEKENCSSKDLHFVFPKVSKLHKRRGILSVVIFIMSFSAAFFSAGISYKLILYYTSFFLLIIISFIDIDYKIIPNGLVLACMAPAAAFFTENIFIPQDRYFNEWWGPFLGLLPGTIFLAVLIIFGYIIFKNDNLMGMGDIKLFIPLGVILGFRYTVLTLFISCVAGAFIQLILIALKIKKRKDTLPFAPYISVGFAVSMLYGGDILRWYLAGF